jgi:4-methyl-5(b-hydroxyethyl)-thiazole monophosphate biosynthesis
MARVLVPLADGFEEIEATTIIDVLRRGGQEVVTASVHDRVDVRGAHGMTVRADALFADVGEEVYDAIVLPGGGDGTENLKSCDALLARLWRQNVDGLLLGAICAAPTVLVAAGAVRPGLHLTCYPGCEAGLDRPSSEAPVVADGNLVTGQAPGSAILFALVVLQTLAGEAAAWDVAGGMVTDVLE